MAKFIKYFGKAHLEYMNVAAYESEDGASVRAENVVNGKSVGARTFRSVEEAEDWWDSLPGSGAGKLANAIDSLDIKS